MFETILDPHKNQLFIFSCKASFPFSFARHFWVVINIQGEISRYEVVHTKHITKGDIGFLHDGHIYKNLYPPSKGISTFPWQSIFHREGRLEKVIELDSEMAAKCTDAVLFNYQYKNTYHLLGPNSNAYVAWILRSLTKDSVELPFNAFGKNYPL